MATAEREVLLAGAHAVAHVDGTGPSLTALLEAVGAAGDILSAAVVAPGKDGLEIVATFGIDEAATNGLAEAIRRPGHPIARTFDDPGPTFDVAPTAPGGPALRSHLPLTVTRGGTDEVLGVLALAHDRATEPEMRQILEAAADLAAVVVERHRSAGTIRGTAPR